MPSLATRRRRAGASESESYLEGGGAVGEQTMDKPEQTRERMKAYEQKERQQNKLRQQAHLVSFPIFLFILLAVFSHSLHLSLLSCLIIPLLLGGILYLLSLLLNLINGKEAGQAIFAENGVYLVFFLIIFTGAGVVVSQILFRDKLGPSLL